MHFCLGQHIKVRLTALWRKEDVEDRGYLSGLIIDEGESLPSSSAYQNRFGSLLRAYALVGYTPDRDYRYIEINRALRRMHPNIVADVIARVVQANVKPRRFPLEPCEYSLDRWQVA
jgi:hypothetical protein